MEEKELVVTIPAAAMIRKYSTCAVFVMPRKTEYEDYRFMVDAAEGALNRFKCLDDGNVVLYFGNTVVLRKRGEEKKLSAGEIYDILSRAQPADYKPKYIEMMFSKNKVSTFPNMYRMQIPAIVGFDKQHITIPIVFLNEEKSTDQNVYFNVPDYMNFSMRTKDGDDVLVNVKDLATRLGIAW